MFMGVPICSSLMESTCVSFWSFVACNRDCSSIIEEISFSSVSR